MVIRTFFDKNNTLVYNQPINTGKNPVGELFYGGNVHSGDKFFSRFIFHFDVERIIEYRNKGMYPDITKLKHTLRLTNTGTFDSSLLGGDSPDGKDRASSFDLEIFRIGDDAENEWHEGVGYDFSGQRYFSSIDDASVTSYVPSNWIESKTGTSWGNGGGNFSDWSGTTVVGMQEFSDGNENIEIDITDVVNGYLTGDTNNGLGIAFSEGYENTTDSPLQYAGFFTRHTQTFYEPYVETSYDSTIVDDRGNFYMDKVNKLYLYVNVKGIPTDVDDMSTMGVTVNDLNGDLFSGFTSSDITHETQGVYSIELMVPTTEFGCVLYEDIWSGITINGITRPPVELEFELKDSNEYYNIGADSSNPKQYTFNVYGIKSKEQINRGDIRKISVMARVPYSVNQQEVLDTLEYRLYVKEGKAEYTVIDYTPVELAFNYNYFLLDTASLVPQTYYLDIKLTSNYEVTTTKNIISFDITSQVDERKS